MRGRVRTAEQIASSIASRQRGCVTRKQLLDAGVTKSGIDRRIEKGYLIREYTGVYRVGHVAPSTETTYMAAVLAAGDGVVICGRAAGHLMKLLNGPAPAAEMIAPKQRHVEGIDVKHERKLDPRDVTTWQGIPTTTIPRTLVDLAAVLDEEELGRAVHQAMVLYRAQPKAVEAVLKRRPNAKGAATLRSILRGDTRITLSRLESRFLEICKANALELPTTNKRIGGRYVDCRWPHRKLTVELDSYRYHSSRHAWEQDRKRERQARARGDDFRRFTWDDVTVDLRSLVSELRPIIGI